jgi:hypothetical protein
MVKGVADAKCKDSHKQQSHENIEKDSNLDDQGHAERRY